MGVSGLEEPVTTSEDRGAKRTCFGDGGVDGAMLASDRLALSGLTSTMTGVVCCRREDGIVSAAAAALLSNGPMGAEASPGQAVGVVVYCKATVMSINGSKCWAVTPIDV